MSFASDEIFEPVFYETQSGKLPWKQREKKKVSRLKKFLVISCSNTYNIFTSAEDLCRRSRCRRTTDVQCEQRKKTLSDALRKPRISMSLTVSVVCILLATSILFQAAMGAIFYSWQYRSQHQNLDVQLEQICDQGSRYLSSPMYNFDSDQMKQIVKNLMLAPFIVRIVVQDESGRLLFEQSREGSTEDNEESIHRIEKDISQGGLFLGSVEVTATTSLVDQNLHQYLLSVITSIFVLTMVQIVTIYLLLGKTIISPIKAIEKYTARISADPTSSAEKPAGLFTGELKSLRRSIIAMVTALLNSEKGYRSLFENSQEGIFLATPTGRFIKANSAFAAILGYSSSEEVKTAASADGQYLFIDDGRESVLLKLVKVKGTMAQQEIALQHRDGHRLHCLISMYPIANENGEISHFEGSLVDISERKQAEEQLALMNQRLESLVEERTQQLHLRNAELAASENQYRSLVETIQEGILVIDQEGKLTFTNRQMSTMLGVGSTELTGKSCRDFIDDGQKELFSAKLQTPGEMSLRFEISFNHADGHQVHTLISPSPLYDSEGRYKGSFAVVTDVTALKHLQTQLLQAQKLESIGQLAAGIAHEVNTPTQYVGSNIEFLKDAFADIAEVLAAHGTLLKALQNGNATAEAVLAVEESQSYHQIESLLEELPGAFKDTFEGLERITNIVSSVKRFAHPGQDAIAPADLNEAIESTITVSTNEWRYVADLEADLDPSLPPVPCNVSAINQVVLIMIVNAAHAIAGITKDGDAGKGRIGIRTRNLGDFVEIRISDTGGGIPENIRSRIFDPFFTTKEVGKGSGQGLAIARTIVTETHHGSIDFETELGLGTTFIVRLPLGEDN